MNALIPAWIIGGPFVGLLFLAFSFKGPSAMGGEAIRPSDRYAGGTSSARPDASAAPGVVRRL